MNLGLLNPRHKSALLLATCVLLATTLLGLINMATRQSIEESQLQWRLDNLRAVLPEGEFDKHPVKSVKKHVAPELGGQEELEIYTLYREKQPLAAVLEIIAPDGYSGQIRLLLGLHADGQVISARVIDHRETPGLGDFIDSRRSDWIIQFNGQSIMLNDSENRQTSRWQTTREGGEFDAVTGATITSRAVIQAIYKAVRWFSLNKNKVFES